MQRRMYPASGARRRPTRNAAERPNRTGMTINCARERFPPKEESMRAEHVSVILHQQHTLSACIARRLTQQHRRCFLAVRRSARCAISSCQATILSEASSKAVLSNVCGPPLPRLCSALHRKSKMWPCEMRVALSHRCVHMWSVNYWICATRASGHIPGA